MAVFHIWSCHESPSLSIWLSSIFCSIVVTLRGSLSISLIDRPSFSSVIGHVPMAEGFHFLVCKACFLNLSRFITYVSIVLMLLALSIIAWFLLCTHGLPTSPLEWMLQTAFCYSVIGFFFFYKTISFHSFSLRNLFFHVCFLSPTLRSPQWQLQLGSNPACLLGFSLQFHLYLDYIYIEALFEECHIAEIVVSTSVRGQDSAH